MMNQIVLIVMCLVIQQCWTHPTISNCSKCHHRVTRFPNQRIPVKIEYNTEPSTLDEIEITTPNDLSLRNGSEHMRLVLPLDMPIPATATLENITEIIETQIAKDEIADITSQAPNSEKMVSNCRCAIFSTKKPKESDSPIYTYPHDRDAMLKKGELYSMLGRNVVEFCRKYCLHATCVDIENLVCSQLRFDNKIKGHLMSKYLKNGEKWTFTGYSIPRAFCCANGVVVNCSKN